MSDPRELLDAIAQRVDRMTKPDPTGQRTYGMDEHGGIAPDTYLTAADRAAGDFDCIGHIAGDLRSLVAALRAVLDLVESMPHDASEEDCWYACAQAKDPYTGEWASCNDSRAGGPCDCGRDAFVAKVNSVIAEALCGAT